MSNHPKPWLTGGLHMTKEGKIIPKKDSLEQKSPDDNDDNFTDDAEIAKLRAVIKHKLSNPNSEVESTFITEENDQSPQITMESVIERLKEI